MQSLALDIYENFCKNENFYVLFFQIDIVIAKQRSPIYEYGSKSKVEKTEFTFEKDFIYSVPNDNISSPEELQTPQKYEIFFYIVNSKIWVEDSTKIYHKISMNEQKKPFELCMNPYTKQYSFNV